MINIFPDKSIQQFINNSICFSYSWSQLYIIPKLSKCSLLTSQLDIFKYFFSIVVNGHSCNKTIDTASKLIINNKIDKCTML